MKFKREIIIISLIIAMLFTVSSVCAVDSGIQATGAQNSTVEVVSASNDNDDLGMNDAGEILAETDDGSFTALNTKISGAAEGSTVDLLNNYTYTSGATAIEITQDNLVIDGHGKTTINANSHTNIFIVSGSGVTIKNIKFINGLVNSGDNGGAITWKGGNGNILNCSFNSNRATGSYDGGAIYTEDIVLNIENCTFIDNVATGSDSGGAISIFNGKLTIKNSKFIHNAGNVGAITNLYNAGVFNQCIFINNTGNTAGSIYWYTFNSGNLLNSIFLNNVGSKEIEIDRYYNNGQYYGNVYANGNWWGNTVENNIKPNVANSVVLNSWYLLNITTNDANNIATLTLNNLYDGTDVKPSETYSLPSVTFDVDGTNATLNKDTITLKSNGIASFGFTVTEDTGKLTASSNGVSISKDVVNMADEGTMAALNTKITDAIANGDSEVKLYNDYVYSDSEPLVTNTIYNGNSNNGIGIATDFTIDGQGFTIDGNNKGGRIFYFRDSSKSLTLKNINFVNCNDQYASAVFVTGKNLEIINCTFTDGTATANMGAGIYASVAGYYKFINSSFTNNKQTSPATSKRSGGAIALITNSVTTGEIINCSFIDNQANYRGGAIYISNQNGGDTLNIDGCFFKGNVAGGEYGSTLYLHSPISYSISNSIILDTEGYIILTDAQGNVDYNWWGSTSDDYLTFNPENIIYGTQTPEDIPVEKWLYLDVVVDNENAVATVSLNNLNDGTAYENYALPEIKLNVQTTNANINTNTVTLDENGQATINYEMTDKIGTLTVSYGDIEVTKEIKLFVQDSFTSLKRQIDESQDTICSLHQNYNYNQDFDQDLTNGVEITKSITIDGNGYTIDAKGVRNIFYFDDVTNTKNLTLKNIIFTNAIRENGAAVYFKGNKIEIINCTFIDNVATGQGDAIYIADATGSENRITESTFLNNTGTNSVVYINVEDSNAKLNLSNSIFLGNDATFDVKGTSNVIADYNWWGNNAEDYKTTSPNVDGATLNNWLVLNLTTDTDTNIATLSLNNLYDGNVLGVYESYALPILTFNIKGTGVTPKVNKKTLGADGTSTFEFVLNELDSSLTATYECVEATTEMHYVIVDDGSFKALNDIIRFSHENDVIELRQNYTFIDGVDTITSGISIDKQITIHGNDTTINAKGKAAIFKIHASNVVLNDINFINGVSDFGGAIYFDKESLTVDNCTFINNTASSAAGAIYSNAYYDMGTITNSKFINNTANTVSVIYNFANTGDIDKCIFINNTGGYVIYQEYCTEKIKNSIFLNNTAKYYGIYAPKSKFNNNWFGNTFDNYKTKILSGHHSNWLYLNIKFSEDYAVVSLNNLYTSSSGSSSVISDYSLPEITLNINSTTLNLETDKITLDANGQAIVPYTKISEDAKLTVSNDYVTLTRDVIIADFDALQDLINNNDEINLTRDYTYNSADSITEGILINKNITIDGGGHTIDAKEMTRIFNVQATNVTFKNIVFANGKSNLVYGNSNDGGAIYFNSESNEKIEFKVMNCTFINNTANIDDLYQPFSGGAIFIKASNGVFNITDSTFINNTAKSVSGSKNLGGAIYVNATSSEFNLYNSSFIGNDAYNGGALYIENDNTKNTIDKCLFRENDVAYPSSTYASAILWKTVNDNRENIVRNSIFLDNNGQTHGNNYAFVLSSGNVKIDDNWWGSTEKNYKNLLTSYQYIVDATPNNWLFINASVSSYQLHYNESSTIRYYLQSYDGSSITEFDNSKLPDVDFDVTCNVTSVSELKNYSVFLNEEFTYMPSDPGDVRIEICCNNIFYEINIDGPFMVPKVESPFTLYANQELSKGAFIKIYKNYRNKVTITCNDSSLINLAGNNDVTVRTNEGTAKLTFSYDGSHSFYPDAESFDIVVNIVKVPLNITVTNLEGNEITLNVTDTLDLDIAFEIDEIHKGYAPAWDVLGVKYDLNVISFDYEKGVRPNNGSYYPTGHIVAKYGGTTNLIIYSTSDKFKWENYTIKITVNKIPTEITLGDGDSFKVDETSNVNAVFLSNGTQSTASLIYESSDEDVVKFTSNTGDFKAVGKGTAVLTVTFNGNLTHEASSKTITVTVSKYSTSTSVTSDKTLELKVDDDSQIEATLTSEDGTDLTLSYESSDETVATVDSDGKITAVGEGTAIITVKYDGNYRYEGSNDTVTVTVSKVETTIDLTSASEISLDVFGDSQIEASLNPSAAGTLSYASSNESVATVDSDGKITAISGGKANITISFAGDNKYGAAEDVNISITVSKLPTVITVDSTKDVDVDASKSLGATVDNGRTLHYESLNPEIVTVDENGVITGVIGGTGVINVSFAEDGQYLAKSATVTVTVNKLTSSITADPIEINVFDSQLIDPTVVSDGVVSYINCDPAIVTVNATNGNITGIKGGKANVTIKVAESDRYLAKEVNVTVTVKKLPTEITVNPAISVDVDGTNTIEASADNGRPLKYESLNLDIVTVNETTGVITGVIGGTGEIKISFLEDDQYLEKTATVTVTVNKLTPTITVDPIDVDVFDSKLINPTIVSDGTVTYESCDSSIVTVDENTGKVTGVIGGVANVTIKVAETQRYLAKEANVPVFVNKVATIITVNPTMRLKMGDSQNIVAAVVSGADIHFHSDSDLITVNETTGLVTAVKGGIAEVTVSVDATDKYLSNSTIVTVTVARLPDDDTPIELSVFSQADVSALYDFGDDPSNLKYVSSNTTVFTVSDAGLLDALAGGESNLTISDEILGESVTIKVIVNKLETPIDVAPAVSIDVYQNISLHVTIPQKADINQLRYESGNPDVVIVDENGKVTGVIGGTATITVSYVEDGQFVANSTDVVVTVNKLQSTITINENEFSVYVDGKDIINATTNNEGGLFYASVSPCVSLANNVVTGVSEGTAEIKVIALENEKYLAKTEIVKVTVNRIPSAIAVGTDEFIIDVDGNVTLEAILNHEGDLTYKYDESIIKVENGLITGLIGGETNITISYAGDNKYSAAEDVNVTVTVNKLPTEIKVNATISVDADGTNTIEAVADGRTLEFISLDESIVTVDRDTGVITGIKGGVANVTVRFSENDKYLGDEVNVTVTVNKLTSTISADPIEINVFDSQLINPTVVSDGVVSYVSCDPAIVTVNATNGNVSGAKGGKANITIKVAEGDKYLANEFNVTVTVNKLPTTITVDSTISIDYGKTENISATADNGGTLIFTSLNPDIVTVDENGLITAVKRGEANITVKFEENDTHEGSEVNVTVTVNGLPIDLIIENANDVIVGGTSTIELRITESDANGIAIVYVNGTENPINISETKSLDVVLDEVGSYDVYAVYQGDDKYLTAESNAVTIKANPKHDNIISVNVTQDIITGGMVEINATSGSGVIDVYVDGIKQIVKDGKVVIDSLSVGQHTIKVVSNETAEYEANSTEFTIDVDKKQAGIAISVLGDLVVDEWININIDYSGSNLIVYMDGKVIDDYEDSFKAIAGNHLIVATVSDDDQYYGATETYNFTVSKKDSEVYVSATPNPVTVGGNTTIDVDIRSDATGIVIIDLNGTKYSLNITESKSLSIVLDKVGSYNLSAQYLGDERYLPSGIYNGTPIEVEDKQISEIDISMPDVIYAGDNVEITVNTGNDNLEVYLDDELKTLNDNKFTIENITAGTHLIKVVSPETAEFKYNSTTKIINVDKKESSVSIEIPETISIGEDVLINVTSTSDTDIAVYVDGIKQTLVDGKLTVKATAGVHNIIASVDESDRYLASSANESFKVDKLDAQISVSATNITEGQNTTVTIETVIGEGIVILRINDTEVAVDLAKAKSVDVLLTVPGDYELSASYLGSDIYNACEALKSTINVAKKETPEVDVVIPEIKANETEPVSISIPNATGEVHVIVDGVDETVTLDENGNATYTLPKMSAGSHSVVIVYPGDEKNVPVIKSVPITVTKQTSQANITPPEDVKEGDDASVKVEIANATGEVIIIVDGVEHKVPLENGTVDYPLNNLSGGNHSVVVIYPGDEAHDASYSASSFNVEVEPVVVKVATEFKNITIDKDLNITVNLVDVNGNPIENAEIIYRIGDEAKSIYTAADGSFTIKGVAKAEVVIEYMGNETFIATNTSLTLENAVPETKLATHFNITEGTTIETYAIERGAGEVGSLYAFKLTDSEGNPLVNASIKFAYKDVIFYGTTNEQGIVYLGVSTYVSQDALCALSYLGDDKHNATFVAFNFKIKQKPTAIKAYQNTFKAAKKNKYYTVTLKTIVGASRDGKVYLGEGKKLTLKINGRTFTAYTNAKGQATFKITNLKKKGKYVAVVKFAGKDPYASSSKKVVIKVK